MALDYKLSEIIRKEKPTIKDFREIVNLLEEERVFAPLNPQISSRIKRGKFLLEYSNLPFDHTSYEFYEMPNVPLRPNEDIFDFLKRWLTGDDYFEKIIEEINYKEWGFEIHIKNKKITEVYIKRNPFKKSGDTYFFRPRKLYLSNPSNELK